MAGERILIVEDERAVARGLEYALAHEGLSVTVAGSGEQALELVDSIDPHLIILDVRLPGMSGFDVCRRLRAAGRRLPILMLTARDEELDRVLGLELGADDYVVKPYHLRELIARVRALLRRAYGELAAEGDQRRRVSFGDVELDLDRFSVSRAGRPVDLTPTEFRLLAHLVANPRRPQSREALIEAVWGYDSSLGSERTVDAHLRHLREKLEPDPANPRWLLTVRGVGYKFEP